MKHHTIRLGSAWEWSADGAAWTRHFGRPSGLEPGDRVLLLVVPRGAAAVFLNAVPLPTLTAAGASCRHEITPLLRDRNTLVLRPDASAVVAAAAAVSTSHGRATLPEAIADVSLEIIPAAG